MWDKSNRNNKNSVSVPIENFVGASWAKVKEVSESDFSWEAPEREFNFDAKYLVQVRNLPWTATRPHITEFFENIQIMNGMEGIHFIMSDKITENAEAFIQFESMRDYTAAFKMNLKVMDDQCIEGVCETHITCSK